MINIYALGAKELLGPLGSCSSRSKLWFGMMHHTLEVTSKSFIAVALTSHTAFFSRFIISPCSESFVPCLDLLCKLIYRKKQSMLSQHTSTNILRPFSPEVSTAFSSHWRLDQKQRNVSYYVKT